MKKSIISKISLALLMFSPLVTLTSCSNGFFSSEEEQQINSIKEIKTEVDENGDTVVTIYYTDETIEPVSFVVPKGEEGQTGQQGVGIVNVTYEDSEDGTETIVTINLSDGTSQQINIPNGLDGKNGYNITKIESSYDEETGITTIRIFTDNPNVGTYGIFTYEVVAGRDGNDGVGIASITSKNNTDNTITITITLTNGQKYDIQTGNMKGETGRGIASVVGTISGNKYVLTINYTDGTSQVVKFDKPKDAAQWITGSSIPSSTLGKNGDFYFDTYHQIIYQKINNNWVEIVNFNDYQTTFTVKFNLNDNNDAVCEGLLPSYTIQRGEYFASSGYTIPLPTRSGYTFNGWYTTPSPNVTNGAFTDLTPVFSDLILYANWIN